MAETKIQAVPTAKALEIISRISLFQDLEESERNLLVKIPDLFCHIPDDTLFITQGGFEENFYILLSGKAQIYLDLVPVAEVIPGDFIGELGFICNEPRTASAWTRQDSVFLRIDRTNFETLPIHLREKIKDRMIRGLVARVKAKNENYIELTNKIKRLEFESESNKLLSPHFD